VTTVPTESGQRTKGEISAVIAMAIPGVLMHSSRALMDVADYVLVKWLNSPDAQAAILPAQMMLWCYMVLPMGVVSMVNTFAAQSLGRKEYRECSAYAWQTILPAVLFGLLAVGIAPALPWLIGRVGHAPAVRAMELAYARIAVLTVFPTIASTGLAAFFTGIHKPWVATWSVVEANILNVLISMVLMFGYFGVEPMGIAGAAWGTFIALCYRTLRLVAALLTHSIDEQFDSRRTWRPSWSRLKGLVRVGTPYGLLWLCDCVVWTIFVTVLIGRMFGTADLIATNTAWQYMRLSFLPTIGFGQALTALVGKSIGAGYPQRAIRETRLTIVLTLCYMGLLSFVYGLAGGWLVSFFSSDPIVLKIGADIMICVAAFQLFDALGITYMAALRGAGDTAIPAAVLFVGNWTIIIGGGWLAAIWFPELGSLGPWIAASGLIAIAGGFLWWRWNSRTWMRINIFDRTGVAHLDAQKTL